MKSHRTPECHNCDTRQQGIFCELDTAAAKELDQRKISNIYKKGQVIFYEGNQSFGMYCVSKGHVKLYKTGIDGKQQILRVAGPGDVLGYRALLANEPYQATAEAIEEVEICSLDKNSFSQVLKKEPSLAMNLIKKLAQELGTAENLATSIAQKSVRERMAELLLSLARAYGEGDGSRISLSLTREELGNMIGVTQETSIRLISDFKEENLIEVKGREICIVDAERLADIAGIEI